MVWIKLTQDKIKRLAFVIMVMKLRLYKMHVYVCIIYVYVYVRIYLLYMYVYMYVCMYVCKYVRMYDKVNTPKERAPGTHWIGSWVGSRAVPDAVVKRKIPNPRRQLNPRTPIVQPVAQRYTN
jgi:hypothetical protein